MQTRPPNRLEQDDRAVRGRAFGGEGRGSIVPPGNGKNYPNRASADRPDIDTPGADGMGALVRRPLAAAAAATAAGELADGMHRH